MFQRNQLLLCWGYVEDGVIMQNITVLTVTKIFEKYCHWQCGVIKSGKLCQSTRSHISVDLLIHCCENPKSDIWGCVHRHNGECKGSKCHSIFFLPKNIFFWLLCWRGANKKIVMTIRRGGGMERNFIKDWFKTVFPLFLTWLLHKVPNIH